MTKFTKIEKPQIQKFPGFYQFNFDEMIVWATSESSGTVVDSGKSLRTVGTLSTSWNNIGSAAWTRVFGKFEVEY